MENTIKRILLVLLCAGLVAWQSVFLYELGHGGAEKFINMWEGFSVPIPAYTFLVFNTLEYWWVYPVACAAVIITALIVRQILFFWAAAAICVLITIALFWATYRPNLLLPL